MIALKMLPHLLILLLCVRAIQTATTSPIFSTLIDNTFEAASAVLSTSSPTTSGSFSSQNTIITYKNFYFTTPSFAYGLAFLNSQWTTTTVATETIWDLSSVTSTTSSQTLRLNFTVSTVLQLSINYLVCLPSSFFFLDVRSSYQDLSSQSTIATSGMASQRSITLSLPYRTKSNSSNAVVAYNTIGLSMMRQKNTFQYTLTTASCSTSTFSVTLTVSSNNGVRFIRFAIFNYQSTIADITPPLYLDIGFVSSLSGSITDSSGLGLAVTGTIVMGMTDWTVSDSNALINYNMTFSTLTFSLTTSGVTRTRSSYVWYRQKTCPVYYFDDGSACTSCHYSCTTCSGTTNISCLTCEASSFRTFDSTTSSCPCNTNYLDVGTLVCQQIICPSYCTSCSSDNFCVGCVSSQSRSLSNGNCVCSAYTIDLSSLGLQSCQACFPTCFTCSSLLSQTACSSCNLSRDHRSYLASNNTCNCVDGYYEVSNLNVLYVSYLYNGVPCLSCEYTCQTCSGPTSCLTCNSTLQRTINSTSGFCRCSDGYYDDGLHEDCKACPYSCATCSSATSCTSCPATRFLSGSACPCQAGYYDSGTATCQACHYSCYTCSNNITCTTCNTTYFRTMSNSTCACLPGYYDIIGIQTCSSCDITCLTCYGSAPNNCLSCSSGNGRQITGNRTCVCMMGFYQLNPVVASCGACYYSCQSCSSSSASCLSCNASNYRQLSGSSCQCMNKYYDDGGNQMCRSCSYFCLTCSNSSSCTTCDSTTRNVTDLSSCGCLTGFYDDAVSSSCMPCLSTCLACNNPTNCTSCPASRYLSALDTCLCSARTFQPNCSSCHYSCLSCATNSSNCQSCNGSAFRYLDSSSGQCRCYISYYDDGNNELCQPCNYSCASCSSGNSCDSCPANRVLNGSYCQCLSTFYQNSVNLNCLPCHYSCTTCSDFSVCTACNASVGRVAGTNTTLCVCSTGFYDNGVNQICFACHVSCHTCSAFSQCTSCLSANHRTIINASCLCNTGYYDDGTALCKSCHYSCFNCTSSASCSFCKPQNFRTYASGPYCSCQVGYFDIAGQVSCSACSYSCLTCQSMSVRCLSCPSTRSLENSSATCPCNIGLYDTGSATCVRCDYTCATCSNSTSCLSCPSTRQLDSSLQCVCESGYYAISNQTLCQLCAPQCEECSDYSTCTSCATASNFRLPQNGTCSCPVGYYDPAPSNYTCQLCPYSCATCSSSLQCTSCTLSFQRLYNSSTLLCSCASQYYDDGTNEACIPCPYDCLTCLNSTTCLTCSATRALNNISRCECTNNYYANGTLCQQCPVECATCNSSSVCTACVGVRIIQGSACTCPASLYAVAGSANCDSCHYSCATCVSPSKCSSCNATLFRYLTASYCLCMARYYDDLSNEECQACHYSCRTCNQTNVCQTCDSSRNRIYNSSSQLCNCASGYYEDASRLCIQCPYSCLTCISSTACSSCNPTFGRVLNTTTLTCDCPTTYYYDTMISAVCGNCDYSCLSCSSATTCTACLNTTFRNLSGSACPCIDGYYGTLNQPICQPCSYQCVTCSGSASTCTLCSSTNFRQITPTCGCMPRYYDAGLALCAACHYSCQTCGTGLTCTSCNSTVWFRTLNLITGLCDCLPQYYDVGIGICQSCHYTCLTCNHPTQCLTCPSSRAFSSKSCVCLPKFFDDGSSVQCISCNYSCQTCTNNASCFSCNSALFRTFNASTSLCSCIGKYYDDGSNELCLSCHVSCLTCAASSACLTCPLSINKTINSTSGSSYCICLYGYYENATAGALAGYNSICQPCSYACETCFNQPTNCTFCNSSSNRYLNVSSNFCQCLTGYFGVAGQQLCIACYTHCLTCTGTLQNNCLSCDNTTYFLNNTCYTSCPSYYANVSTPSRQCASCSSNCLRCSTSLTVCEECASPFFIFSYNSSYAVCVNQCPPLYYQINQTCYPCQAPCITCSALMTCLSCSPNYYLASGYCYPCEQSCLTCSGSTALDCLSCVPNYILRNSVCQKITCSSTQYVQSTLGCQQCSSSFANSLTCLSTGPLTCLPGYLLSNASCQVCSSLPGYTLDLTTGFCKDKCGDGLIISDLCDDGNTLNGDGCSSSCQIQSGWRCYNNSCSLISLPSLTLTSINSFPRNQSIVLVVGLTVGVRLVEGNFILKFTSITNYRVLVQPLNPYWTSYMLVITYYQTAQNQQLSISVKSPISRLLYHAVVTSKQYPAVLLESRSLSTTNIQLNISLYLQLTVSINTSPPAIYVSEEQSNLYAKYLMGLVAMLHGVILAAIVVVLLMRLKVMLIIIDALNSLTILYILSGLGLYNVTLLSYQSSVGLQPFVYAFGQELPDSSTNFSFFNYRSNFFSSSTVQCTAIIFCLLATFFYKASSKAGEQEDNVWYYYRTGFVFAFAYDLLLSAFCIFLWSPYNSYQSSYSWTTSILLCIWIICEAVYYYRTVSDLTMSPNKVVPAVSFITNDLEGKDKSKAQQNIFEFEAQQGQDRKIPKGTIDFEREYSQQKTQIIDYVGLDLSIKADKIKYFDLTPSGETEYSLRHSNHISPAHLPLMTVFFSFLFALISGLQSPTTRTGLLFAACLVYLICQLVTKGETIKAIRMGKLLVLSLMYILISLVGLVSASAEDSVNLRYIDIAIIILVCLTLIINLVSFILNVYKSEAYKEYQVAKKNQEIIERNRRQNETRLKIYNKSDPPSKLKKPSTIEPSSQLQILQPEIQLSEEQVEEKEIKISQLKKSRGKLGSSRTVVDRDVSSLIHMQIDDEISEIKPDAPYRRDLVDEKQLQQNNPSKNNRYRSPGSRIQAMSNSELSIQRKGETPSMLIDHTLERIEELRGPSRTMEKQQVSPTVTRKKAKKKVKGVKAQQKSVYIEEHKPQVESSVNLEDILSEMDMPRGFKMEQKTEEDIVPRRLMDIDEISSIKEERQQFMEQAISDQAGGMSVFNKILQDYKVYRNKKVDKKKIREVRDYPSKK